MFRSLRNYDTNHVSDDSALICTEPTLTQQNFKEQCDINRIVKQYAQTGVINANTSIPLPDEFVGITDYHTAMNLIKRSEDAFMALEPHLRERFANNPANFVDFVTNPANIDELRSMGLAYPANDQAQPGQAVQAQPENPPSQDATT